MTTNKLIAARTNPVKGFRIHLLIFLVTIPAIWLVWYLTDRNYPWPLWNTSGWFIGILFHYLGVFVFKKNIHNQNFHKMKSTVLSLLIAVFATFSCSSYAKNEEDILATTNTYVLVHGAWQAPYVWDAVRSDLVKKGHKVIVVELPGHGADHTAPHTLSLDVYRDKVMDAISQVEGKVILVGHSMGGMVVTQVAEQIPDKISKLVYIGAFLPANGQALTDLAFSDPDSKLGPSLVPSEDQLTIDVKRENLIDLFIHDGAEAAKQSVHANYRPEPAIPFTNKVTLTKEGFGSVEKVYIKTLQDVVISKSLQDRMIAEAGIENVYEMNTSHSPFLSQPQIVSALLIKIGQ